ncbi:MAG: serine acetyltransferase [Thermodesulfobacteriota bacterium]
MAESGQDSKSEQDPLIASQGCGQEQGNVFCQRSALPAVVDRLVTCWQADDCFDHVGPVPIPSQQVIVEIIYTARRILFPGYFSEGKLHRANLQYFLGQETAKLYDLLQEQICLAIRHDCRRANQPCSNCEERSHRLALSFIQALPEITATLAVDIRATLEGDPAAQGADDVIFSYPGLMATVIHRLAHELFRLGVVLIPRIMSEHAHTVTGIDIHPGATIAPGLFIDHGTGVVIGETAIIGPNVRIYQGVTLGALSLPRDAGSCLRNVKRHPTIEEGVIIYANTTILGGDTVIGAHAIIGGNIWLTRSVAPHTKVLLKRPELIYSEGEAEV